MPRTLDLLSSLAYASLLIPAILACRGGSCAGVGIGPEVLWANGGYEVAEAHIGGEKALGLVGLCEDSSGTGPIRACAFDGEGFELLWESAPIGEQGNAYLVKLGVAAGRVAVSDALGVLHVLDLENGKEVGHVQLTDRADQICAPAEDPRRIWIAAKDRKTSFLDPRTLRLVPAPRPASCPAGTPGMSAACSAAPPAARAFLPDCALPEAPPSVPDFAALEVAIDGRDGVATGIKTQGSSVPMIVGFAPGRGGALPTLRWQRGVAPGSPLSAKEMPLTGVRLAGGRAFVTYRDLEDQTHIEALDAKSGKTSWDVKSGSLLQLRATPTRVYVVRWTRLDVRDAATGELLGGVGRR